MTYNFPSQPLSDPQTIEDGCPNVRFSGMDVHLCYKDFAVVIPGTSILRDSIIVKPGDSGSVNMVQVTLLVCDVDVVAGTPESADTDMIKVQYRERLMIDLVEDAEREAANRPDDAAGEDVQEAAAVQTAEARDPQPAFDGAGGLGCVVTGDDAGGAAGVDARAE